ncbi:sugar-binding transcriptional regulator [Amycolatopsis sp. cmx-8-4]|uniref:sugar-binding transcriptional regulator n=1 Tax=Amycolatopsis sp. cmx-8-4 TaxID=2790947 RepID=UPI00397A5099
MDDAEWQLLSDIARRFYIEDVSKTELAETFSMSRFRVARLLQQAREEGVVTIEINERDADRAALSEDLAAHLRLQECIVVKAGDTEDDNRRRLARAAAAHIKSRVRDGDVVGFSWGRTLLAVAERLTDLAPCTVVQLTGTVGKDFARSPVEVIRRIADQSSVEAVPIYAPLFATSEAAARSLRSDQVIKSALSLYADLGVAVLSVGSWEPPITELPAILTSADRQELSFKQAKAEMAGIFLREDGTAIDAKATRRRISVSVSELAGTPCVLAVAGSVEKAGAIAAAARSGLITSLITDDRTAVALRRLPAVESHVLDRRSR